MPFQAYLDALEDKTGLTPRQMLAVAKQKGLDHSDIKAAQILEWLKTDYGLGRGHGMALVHVIKKGPDIDAKHVGTAGSHRDEADVLVAGRKRQQTLLTAPFSQGIRGVQGHRQIPWSY